jgi:hypothetical protein
VSNHKTPNKARHFAPYNGPKVATLSSNVSDALDNLWKFSAKDLSTQRALELEDSPKTLNLDTYEWINGLKLSRIVEKRKFSQQEEAKAKAYVTWIPSSHSTYELGSLPNTVLVSPPHELQKRTGKLKRKVSKEGEPEAKRYCYWPQSRAPENHSSSAACTTACNDLSGCKSLDPRLYQNHPFACGCSHISHLFSPEVITSSISSSGCTSCNPNIYERRPHSCRCNKPAPPAASSFTSGRTGSKASSKQNTSFDFEEQYEKPRLSKGNAPYGLEDWNSVFAKKESPPSRMTAHKLNAGFRTSTPLGKALMPRIRALMPMDSAPTLIVKAPKSMMSGASNLLGSLSEATMAAGAVMGSRTPTAVMGSRAPTAVMGSVYSRPFSQPRTPASSVVRTSANHSEDLEKGYSARGF